MELSEAKKIVESLLFSTDTPLAASRLKSIIPNSSSDDINNCIKTLNEEYGKENRSFTIQEIAGGFQVRTKPEYHEWLLKLKRENQETKLSNAALEVLSIISYKQPVMRAEIESIRGVDSSAIIRALMEKGLVRISGRSEQLGHPILYGTAPKFLELLGLNSIQDLPKAVELR